MASPGRSINGANALITIQVEGGDERVVGYATGVTVQEVIALNRIDVLGRIESKDIEAIGRSVSGSIGLMRMVPIADPNGFNGGGAANASLLPKHAAESDPLDDADATGRTRTVMSYMDKGFNLKIKDAADYTADGDTVDSVGSGADRYVIVGCRPSSHSFSLSRGTLMGVNVTFEAIAMTEVDAVINEN